MGLQFRRDAHAAIADGSLTVTYRAWKRPQVRVGGTYRIGDTTVEVTAIDVVGLSTVPDAHRRWLGDADPVFRIDFRRCAPAEQRVLPVDDIERRLDRLDRAAAGGPWTRPVLMLIRDNPGVVSTVLAAAVGRERLAFKADVRKLKALGLTESLEVGYRLSPLGEDLVRRT